MRVFLIVVLFLLARPAFAQQGTECSAPDLARELAALVAGATSLDGLEAAWQTMGMAVAACRGLNFEGSGNAVVGPFEVPAGIYRVTFTNDSGLDGFGMNMSSATIEGRALEGTCDTGMLLLFLDMSGANASEFVFESNGCHALWELSNVNGDWTLTLQRLG